MSPVKEPHYFTFEGEIPTFPGPGGGYFPRVAISNRLEYETLFSGVATERAIGEASTTYLNSNVAALRIKNYVPEAKIIILLRHPADRAYSQYNYYRFHRIETSPDFSVALENEAGRINDGWSFIHFHQKESFYFQSLKRYFDQFPREQIKIYLYEDWYKSPKSTLQDLFKFLEVNEDFPPNIQQSNVSLIPKNCYLHGLASRPNCIEKRLNHFLPAVVRRALISCLQHINNKYNLSPPPPLGLKLRQQLTDGYYEDIIKTQELIGLDLSNWLKPVQP
jgi:hypothetical protein